MADHIVCRCEDVTVRDVQEAIDAGATNAQEVKMRTRAGMGPCQGRVCRSIVESMLGAPVSGLSGVSSRMTVHLPVRPVALSDLVAEEDR
jgi:NAD(P)H-nitrite reductase large subunit